MKTFLLLYLALVVAWPFIFVAGKAIAKVASGVSEKAICRAVCQIMYDIGNEVFSSGALPDRLPLGIPS